MISVDPISYTVLIFVLCVSWSGVKRENSDPLGHEDGDEGDISGSQFVCETVIRSLALEEAPDHKPPRRHQPSYCKPKGEAAILFG